MTDKVNKNISEAIWILEECEEYFDNKADADYDQDGPVPNKEMILLSKVQDALERLRITKPVTQGGK